MTLQQLERVAQATADATGAATFTFESVPQGLAWLGNVRVAGAPFTATMVAAIGNDDWGEWQGPLFYGPIRCGANRTLTVGASFLVPGAHYIATWKGKSDDDDMVEPATPTSSSPTPTAFPATTFIDQTFVAPFNSAVLPCSNVKGARYAITNNGLDNFNLFLRWFPGDITPAEISASVSIGDRLIMIPAGGSAFFSHPHLGDLIQLFGTRTSGANPVSLTVLAAHHDDDKIVWNNIAGSQFSLPDTLLGGAVAITAGNSLEVDESFKVYAGPATWSVQWGGTLWAATLQALDFNGTFRNIARADNATAGGAEDVIPVLLPPTKLQVVGTNGDAATHTMTTTLVVDSWR